MAKNEADQQPGAQANPAPQPSAREAAIEQWFQDSFPGSVVAQNTECWNVVRRAVDDLKTRLPA